MKRSSSIVASRVTLTLAALGSLAACAGEVPSDPSIEASGVQASEALLATVQVSPTHVVEFYEAGPGHGIVNEHYQMDRGEVSALAAIEIDDGDLLGVYRQLVGAAVDPGALARLQGYEQRRLAFMAASVEIAANAPERVDPPAETLFTQYTGPIQKDRDDEARWFAGRFCDSDPQPDGCLGHDGVRYSWLPTDLPVCTNIVEVCGTGFAVPAVGVRTSRNLRWAAYNQDDVDYIHARLSLDDPCQNDSWWDRLTMLCRKGALLREINIGPHAAFESTSTSSASWTRRLELTGAAPVGMKLNVY
jgi:hypothetical protein